MLILFVILAAGSKRFSVEMLWNLPSSKNVLMKCEKSYIILLKS